MRATGHLRSQTTNEFLDEARKWNLVGNITETHMGIYDTDKVVRIELSLQQLARLADILRHAFTIYSFDLEKGYHLKDVQWTSYEERVSTEQEIELRRRTTPHSNNY